MSSNYEQKNIDELKEIPGVGELESRVLFDHGYRTIEDINNSSFEELSEIEEIGGSNAKDILEGLESGEGRTKEEIFCPGCGVIVHIDEDECPECGHSLKIQGKVFHHDGEIERPLETLAEYEKEILDDGGKPEPYYGKASILEKMGELEKALELYDKVIELDPLFGHIWTAKASLSLRLGKLKDAAKAYKVAVNKHQISLPDIPEAKEEEGEVEERAFSVKEVEDKVTEARRSFFKLKRGNLPLEHLESVLKGAVEARNNDEREKAVEKADELLELVNKIEEISSVYEEVIDAIEDVEYEEISEMMDEIHSEIQEERFDRAEELCQEVLSNVEEIKEKEEVVEEEERVTEDIEEELQEIIEDEKEIEKEVTEEDFIKKFDEAREALNDARKTKINIDNIKELVKKTVEARKDEDYKKGMKTAEKALELSEEVNKIYSLVEEGKSKVKKLRNKGGDVKPFLSKLREGKDLADEWKYEEAEELYKVTINDIDTFLDGGELEIIDNEEAPADSAEEMTELLNIANDLGLDTGSASEYIEKVDENENASEYLTKAREEIFKGLPEYMDKKVEGAKEELKEAKLSDADIDVSKCIHLLKQARKAEKREDYESTLIHMKEYQKELEST
ncbi:MAG: helix-hairpin-helix domain-containing protein [Candidatus Saliniplasma sp.]